VNDPAPAIAATLADSVGALTFDVFGTVVDWRGTVMAEGQAFGRRHGLEIDWERFADRWRREGYVDAIARINRGDRGWTRVDHLHRAKLDQLLAEHGVAGLPEAEIAGLNRVWHRLRPWPDVPEGLARLRKRFVIASLSNGDVALLVDMARAGGFAWDCVLSSELAGTFKPNRDCYLMAARLLDLPPQRIMMVAAHNGDLRGARAAGLRTALVVRPLEYGLAGRPDLVPDPEFDIAATDFVDLARRLGC
jgi:2-haloacid dehalogenase